MQILCNDALGKFNVAFFVADTETDLNSCKLDMP